MVTKGMEEGTFSHQSKNNSDKKPEKYAQNGQIDKNSKQTTQPTATCRSSVLVQEFCADVEDSGSQKCCIWWESKKIESESKF